MNNKGQGIVEYAIIMALVVVVMLVLLTLFGNNLADFFRDIINQI